VLKANQGEAGPAWTDAAIATALKVHPATVARIACGTSPPGWTPRSPARRPRQYRHALDGEQETHLVALACSVPPQDTSGGRRGS
jgi:hypothetical protein